VKQGKEINFTPNGSGSADFSYSMRGKVISITGLNLAKGSFVDEVEKALRHITHWHQTSINGFRIS
jgi:hypothetical protein